MRRKRGHSGGGGGLGTGVLHGSRAESVVKRGESVEKREVVVELNQEEIAGREERIKAENKLKLIQNGIEEIEMLVSIVSKLAEKDVNKESESDLIEKVDQEIDERAIQSANDALKTIDIEKVSIEELIRVIHIHFEQISKKSSVQNQPDRVENAESDALNGEKAEPMKIDVGENKERQSLLKEELARKTNREGMGHENANGNEKERAENEGDEVESDVAIKVDEKAVEPGVFEKHEVAVESRRSKDLDQVKEQVVGAVKLGVEPVEEEEKGARKREKEVRDEDEELDREEDKSVRSIEDADGEKHVESVSVENKVGRGVEEEEEDEQEHVDEEEDNAEEVENARNGRKSRRRSSGAGGSASKDTIRPSSERTRGRSRRDSSNAHFEWIESVPENVKQISSFMAECYRVLLSLSSNKISIPFRDPVQEKHAPNYHEIIKNPMDLSTIQTKLEQGQLLTPYEFHQDLLLICKNAVQYNPRGSDLEELAKEFRGMINSEMNPIVERWKKSTRHAFNEQSESQNLDEDPTTTRTAGGARRNHGSSKKLQQDSASVSRDDAEMYATTSSKKRTRNVSSTRHQDKAKVQRMNESEEKTQTTAPRSSLRQRTSGNK